MEFTTAKHSRSRKRRRHLKKRRRNQIKFEVKSAIRQRFISEYSSRFNVKEKLLSNTMQAGSFWENYTVAQEWQKRHNVTWWRSRCFALEHENRLLRDKLRSLACQNAQQCSWHAPKGQDYKDRDVEEEEDVGDAESAEENESLEFHVNEDMMSFLEQSIRHKIELKKKREAESLAKDEEECIQGGAAWMQARKNNAKLLYGESSPTILAMETALQTSVDRHKDKAKPQYWPIIPLKP
ncbi:uncharacterized protein LOC143371615 [Andrena cerasifolii]|uniref:uncharacterized protein LOC143371615 n=1 Tax=Andrena cerasifolii TaxID=2819439 RepID=UPI0040376850